MEEISESPSQDGARSRRNVLVLLGGAIAGAVAGAVGRPERAMAGHDGTNVLHLGEDNTAPAATRVSANTDDWALRITNDHSGVQAGGIEGSSVSYTGVSGTSETWVGTSGASQTWHGVSGFSVSGHGVTGKTEDGVGVLGQSDNHAGVVGESGAGGVGGIFSNPNGVGLRVVGRAAFSTCGSGTVPQGQNSVFVSNPAVTASSHISVTLVGNPGNREVRWVDRSPGSGFTLNLAPAPPNQRPATPFTYLVIEATA